MDEIRRLIRQMKLLAGVILAAAGITLIGLILFLFGLHTWGLLVMLLATQGLVAGAAVVLYRALLLRTPGPNAQAEAEPAPRGASTEDIVEALRGELSATTSQQQQLGRLLTAHREATVQRRRSLFTETFTQMPGVRVSAAQSSQQQASQRQPLQQRAPESGGHQEHGPDTAAETVRG
ncbi:hypothetical protein [Nesterenkonia aerolata]|uniref:Superfamily III holin-X n=1 Tax=Nesterenkonia aerolata TaxID=3074079 RepID=A0ABU2DR49_9MICC|nr:hypothetical protein [Nesterenkonia sp. LY-0111]MDR8018891.1 hypothetical protein [Nesterenkonia sp. LY-0111]